MFSFTQLKILILTLAQKGISVPRVGTKENMSKILPMSQKGSEGCCSPVVRLSGHGRHVMSSSPVPLKTRRVGEQCSLNMSRAQTSFHWFGVVVRRGGASSGVVLVI
ncbi:hypothetical protein TNCV_146791 [Trichonephila clavipes]|nr:hypothetical protein TNCV_146791 [Trichonephila clavipes]